jgi:hypothetical protein
MGNCEHQTVFPELVEGLYLLPPQQQEEGKMALRQAQGSGIGLDEMYD